MGFAFCVFTARSTHIDTFSLTSPFVTLRGPPIQTKPSISLPPFVSLCVLFKTNLRSHQNLHCSKTLLSSATFVVAVAVVPCSLSRSGLLRHRDAGSSSNQAEKNGIHIKRRRAVMLVWSPIQRSGQRITNSHVQKPHKCTNSETINARRAVRCAVAEVNRPVVLKMLMRRNKKPGQPHVFDPLRVHWAMKTQRKVPLSAHAVT